MVKKRSNFNKMVAVNHIADDWLLIQPSLHKAQLISILNSFEDDHLQEVFSFHHRIYDYDPEEKRKVLKGLPQAFEEEISRMLRAYAEEIERANHAYYNLAKPILPDADYDILEKLLQNTWKQQKRWKEYFDRINIVGSKLPTRGFAKVQHAVPMLSLGNAFDDKDVADFVDRVRRLLKLDADEIPAIVAEPKIDGLSLSLRYEDGELALAATRGDGFEGEDVTANVRTIADIPHRLEGRNFPTICEVRGEVYMMKKDFLAFNQKQEKAGEAVAANPRNFAAGSLRQKNASITASRPLKFFAYTWGEMSEWPADTQHDMLAWMDKAGFVVNPLTELCKNAGEVLTFYRKIGEKRASLGYDIDGVV
jgi:DNA ligase (NAD+)